MSLTVYLHGPRTEVSVDIVCSECDHVHQHMEQHCDYYFDYNITHNLNVMAEKAGIYKHLWRPNEVEITTANQLIEPLTTGLEQLKENPNWFKQFNPANGWGGSYDGLVKFVTAYLAACIEHPEALVEVSR